MVVSIEAMTLVLMTEVDSIAAVAPKTSIQTADIRVLKSPTETETRTRKASAIKEDLATIITEGILLPYHLLIS